MLSDLKPVVYFEPFRSKKHHRSPYDKAFITSLSDVMVVEHKNTGYWK
jgi:hypothetical protein